MAESGKLFSVRDDRYLPHCGFGYMPMFEAADAVRFSLDQKRLDFVVQ